MGFASYFENSVNNALTTYVVTYSDAVVAVMTPIAVTAVTSYVMWTGFQVARGEAKDSVSTITWRWFRVAMIAGLALNGPEYRNIAKDGLDGIQEAFAFAFGGAITVGATIDNMTTPFLTLTSMIMNEATTGMVPQFSLLVAGAISAIAGSIAAIVAAAIFLVAKISLALLFAIGPAFIFCGMFPVTQRYAESWLSSVLVALFTNVLIMATVTLLSSLLSTACANIITSYSDTSVIKDVIGLFCLSSAAAYVLLNIQTLAGGLAGGLSLGSAGGDVLSALSGLKRLFKGVSSPTTVPPGQMINTTSSNAGLINGGTQLALPSPTGAAASDLYQRGVLERLQRAT
jgi:type IV secretion system protein VirB6